MKADGAMCVTTFFERGFGGVHNLASVRFVVLRVSANWAGRSVPEGSTAGA
jgi:hypothetical protein